MIKQKFYISAMRRGRRDLNESSFLCVGCRAVRELSLFLSSVNRKLCVYQEVCDVSPRRLNVPSVANGFLGSRNIYAPVRATGRDSVRRVTGMMNDLASSSMIIAPRQSDVSRQVELCPFLAVESWLVRRNVC